MALLSSSILRTGAEPNRPTLMHRNTGPIIFLRGTYHLKWPSASGWASVGASGPKLFSHQAHARSHAAGSLPKKRTTQLHARTSVSGWIVSIDQNKPDETSSQRTQPPVALPAAGVAAALQLVRRSPDHLHGDSASGLWTTGARPTVTTLPTSLTRSSA